MKKKLLFCGINMNAGGTEKSFLSFVNCIDFDQYEVSLVLAREDGLFLPLVPENVKIYCMEDYGELFFLSGSNAKRLLTDTCIKRNPLSAFVIAPYYLESVLIPGRRVRAATQLWLALAKKIPAFRPEEEYDAAIAYWGDRSMFYMIDKVRAKQKIAWLHFDYSFPPRDDKTYDHYFEKCDVIVTVSTAVDRSLKDKFPQYAEKCVQIDNIQSPALIRRMASEGGGFSDGYSGKRILTVGRIAPQKGFDLAVRALHLLRQSGIDARWYVLGDGEPAEKQALQRMARELGIEHDFVLLGTTTNPYPYMAQCDIYAQPSRYEGKPIAVEEAKILAKPILAANYLSANEQLKGGEYGVIAQIDAEDIFKKLRGMLDHPNQCVEMSERLAKVNFGNETEFDKFLSILEGNGKKEQQF